MNGTLPPANVAVPLGPVADHNWLLRMKPVVEVQVYRSGEGEYVAADQAGWLPGVFSTVADALAAARLVELEA